MNQNYQCLDTGMSTGSKKGRHAFKHPPKNSGFVHRSWHNGLPVSTKSLVTASLMLFLLLFNSWNGSSQVNSYGFTATSGTYTAITDGTVLGTASNDEQVFNNNTSGGTAPVSNTGFPIGFNFTYNGSVFDKFAVASNGYIVLGTGTFSIANSTTGAISTSTTSGYANVISAFNQDLQGQTGATLTYKLIGTAPNRTLVVQWSNYKRWNGSGTMNFNFQIRLNETSNTVEIVYGTMTTVSTYTAAVGLRGASNSVTNTRTSTTNWMATTAGTNSSTVTLSSTVFPASGTTFTWVPPVPCDGTPVAGTITAPSPVCAGGTPSALTATGGSSGVTGLTYQWEESDDDGASDAWANAVGGTGATTSTYTPPAITANRYYRLKVTCGTSSLFSYSNSVVAAVSLCDYNVTRSTGISYSSIAATGTGLTGFSSVDDGASSLTNIGFNFFYKGTTYTQFSASTNGIISLGTTNTAWSNSLSSNTNVIAPFWDDLYVTGSVSTSQVGTYIKYKLDGTAPNRVLTVEWIGMEQFNYPGPNLNFQAKIYETTNKIEFLYGSMEVFNGTTSTSTSTAINKWSYSVGLAGPSGSGTFRTLALLGENSSAFGSTDPTTLAVAPECFVKYEFTPAASYTGSSTFSYAAPANDNVAGAVTLEVNDAPCTNLCGTYYTTGSATASPQTSSCTTAPDDDVWFKFVAPSSGQVTISVKGATGFDAVVSLTDESFADVAGFGCIDATTGSTSNTNLGQTETLDPTGLTPGATYYVRVSHKGTGFGSRSGFSICVNNSVIPPPANDDPCGAVALTLSTTCTPYSDTAAVNSTTSVLSATNTTSNGVAAPSCSGASASVNDVWFKFTATSTTHVLTVAPVAGFDVAAQLYTAAGSCGGNDLVLTSVSCNNTASTGATEQIVLTTVQGTEYYVRVYRHPSGFTGAPVNNSQFSICVFSPVPACTTNTTPANAATGTSLTPTLTWAAAQYATSYDIYLGTQSGPTTLLANATTTSYTLTAEQALAGLTQHYWYVVPKNANGAPTCGAANQTSFTTQTACRVPTAVTVNNLNTTNLTVDLSWTAPTAGPAPAGYEYAFTTSATPPASGTLTTETSVTGQTIVAGTGYYLHVRTSCGGGDFSAWATSSVFRYIAGDTCATALNLATLTSPYNGTTANAANNFDAPCDEDSFVSSPDIIFYIDVQPFETLTIGQTTNSYDSFNYIGYGGACPGATSIACYDDSDTQSNVWLNTTGSVQRVYWVQDGYDGASGAYTLSWSIAPPPECLPPSAPSVNINGTSVVASWTASESEPSGGYIYEIRTSGAAGSGATGLFNTGTIAETQTNSIPNFVIGTSYTLYVRSVCDSGNSPWSSLAFVVPAPNDTCANATALTCGSTLTGSTVGATNENMAVCGITGLTTQNSAGVWYKLTGDGSDVTVSTCSPSQADTRMAVYTGACGTLTCIAGNEDNNSCTTATWSSEVLFSTTPGTEYYVLVYAFSNTEPVSYNISMSCVVPCTPANSNDECANATALTVGTSLVSNNTCSTPSAGVAYPSCGSQFATYYDSWYTFNSGSNTVLEVSAIPTGTASVGYILYTGSCGSLTPVASSCFTNGAANNVTLTANTDYIVRVYTNGASGRGDFTVTVKVPCARPTGVASSAVTTNSATISWTAPASVPGGGYQYEVRTSGAAGSGLTGLAATAATTGVTANLTGLAADTTHSVYVRSVCGEGDYSPWTSAVTFTTVPSCYKPTAVTSSNITSTTATIGWTAPTQVPANGYQWEVRTSGAAGSGSTGLFGTSTTSGTSASLTGLNPSTTYTIYVRSSCEGSDNSTWTTAVTFRTKVANDACAGAISLTCGQTVSGSTADATNEAMAVCGIPDVTTQNTNGVWYKFTGTGGDVTVSTCSANTDDSRIAIYSGACGSLTCVAGNDDNNSCTAETLSSEALISNTVAGATYYVLVYAYSSSSIVFDVTISCAPLCSPASVNNECASAPMILVGASTASNNTCSTPSTGYAYPSCGSSFATYYDTWFRFNTGANTSVNVAVSATAPTAVGYAVYSGTCGSLTQVGCNATGAASTITGLTPHTVYYVRAYSTSPGARGAFTINLTVPCTAPSGVTSVNSATSAVISWSSSSSLPTGGYEYEVRSSGAAGSGSTGLVASGTTSNLSATVSGLTAATSYSVYVRSACGNSSFSSWTSAYTLFTGYCTPAPSSVSGNGITNVTFSTVNNTTGAEAGNYADYSAQEGTAVRTEPLMVNVTFGSAHYLKIWIDINGDLDFSDSGELVYSSATASASFAAEVAIPQTALLGTRRMRIGGRTTNATFTECFTGTNASFEDYSLVLTSMGEAHLISSQCDATVESFNTTIFSNFVNGATAYRFRVRTGNQVEVLERSDRWFKLNLLQTIANTYGTTYLVDVSVNRNGTWSDYGSACKVTVPSRTSQLRNCGAVINSFNEVIYAVTVPQATAYRFRVVSSAGTVVLDRPTDWFKLNMLPTYAYGTTYTVSVNVLSDGVWSGYGPACDITSIGQLPSTQLRSADCGATISSFNAAIYATPVPLAETYNFTVTSVYGTQTVSSSTNWFKLNMLSNYDYNVEYTVSVTVSAAGAVTSAPGATCTVTSAANPPLTSLRAVDCGATIATRNVYMYANPVAGAVTYRFRITSGSGTQTINKSVNYFRIRELIPGSILSGETFTVDVMTISANGSQSAYGSVCNVTLSAFAGRLGDDDAPSITIKGYPNPFTETFGVELSSDSEEMVNIVVFDMAGKLVDKIDVEAAQLPELKLGGNLAAGVYNLVVTQGGTVKTLRIVKNVN
jgi:hypothetical protein